MIGRGDGERKIEGRRGEDVHPRPMTMQMERVVSVVQVVLRTLASAPLPTTIAIVKGGEKGERTHDNEINNLHRILRDHELVAWLGASSLPITTPPILLLAFTLI